MKNRCEECTECLKDICHQGLSKQDCPKTKLENEKLIYGALLLVSVVLLVFQNCRIQDE